MEKTSWSGKRLVNRMASVTRYSCCTKRNPARPSPLRLVSIFSTILPFALREGSANCIARGLESTAAATISTSLRRSSIDNETLLCEAAARCFFSPARHLYAPEANSSARPSMATMVATKLSSFCRISDANSSALGVWVVASLTIWADT
eukprot:scaffold62_cov256-Pinguiococcus_pyrenoidosus.AAC.3